MGKCMAYRCLARHSGGEWVNGKLTIKEVWMHFYPMIPYDIVRGIKMLEVLHKCGQSGTRKPLPGEESPFRSELSSQCQMHGLYVVVAML